MSDYIHVRACLRVKKNVGVRTRKSAYILSLACMLASKMQSQAHKKDTHTPTQTHTFLLSLLTALATQVSG